MELLEYPAKPTDRCLTSVSGRSYVNQGTVSCPCQVRRGDTLMFYLRGFYSIGDVAEIDGGKVRFVGDGRWFDPTLMWSLLRVRAG